MLRKHASPTENERPVQIVPGVVSPHRLEIVMAALEGRWTLSDVFAQSLVRQVDHQPRVHPVLLICGSPASCSSSVSPALCSSFVWRRPRLSLILQSSCSKPGQRQPSSRAGTTIRVNEFARRTVNVSTLYGSSERAGGLWIVKDSTVA